MSPASRILGSLGPVQQAAAHGLSDDAKTGSEPYTHTFATSWLFAGAARSRKRSTERAWRAMWLGFDTSGRG